MKHVITFSLAIFAFSLFSYSAIWTVDNSVLNAGQFSNPTTAIASAAEGDTILFHPSETVYPSFTVDKRLVIIGPGAYNPATSAQTMLSFVSFGTGSSNSILKGFRINSYTTYSGGGNKNNIVITQNRFVSNQQVKIYLNDNTDGWLIEGNLFQYRAGSTGHIAVSGADQTIIKNNVFEHRTGAPDYEIIYDAPSTTIFTNNLLLMGAGRITRACSGVNITNNILYMNDADPFTNMTSGCSGCNYENNLLYNASGIAFEDLPGNNIMNVNPLFVNIYLEEGNPYYVPTAPYDYTLQASSPGANAGSDGTDVGHYGAGYDYDPLLFPNYPRMLDITPSVVNVESGQTFTISIDASNQ